MFKPSYILATLLITIHILLVGCTPKGYSTDNDYVLPEGLKDCNTYYLLNSNGVSMNVVRCPNSNVTTSLGGKHPQHTTVIDGVTYVKQENSKD